MLVCHGHACTSDPRTQLTSAQAAQGRTASACCPSRRLACSSTIPGTAHRSRQVAGFGIGRSATQPWRTRPVKPGIGQGAVGSRLVLNDMRSTLETSACHSLGRPCRALKLRQLPLGTHVRCNSCCRGAAESLHHAMPQLPTHAFAACRVDLQRTAVSKKRVLNTRGSSHKAAAACAHRADSRQGRVSLYRHHRSREEVPSVATVDLCE